MNISVAYQFSLDSPLDLQQLQQHIPQKFSLRFFQSDFESAQALDTFDSILRCSGRLLLNCKDTLLLFMPNTPGVLNQAQRTKWRFLQELSDGPLKDALQDVSELRAFLSVCELELQIHELILLDDKEKTHAEPNYITFDRVNRRIASEPPRL